MEILHPLAVARADAANLARFIERRERFLDALDWPMMSEEHARQSSMLDDLLEGDMADAILYIDWLVDRLRMMPDHYPAYSALRRVRARGSLRG